jgi:hypothetical protein
MTLTAAVSNATQVLKIVPRGFASKVGEADE